MWPKGTRCSYVARDWPSSSLACRRHYPGSELVTARFSRLPPNIFFGTMNKERNAEKQKTRSDSGVRGDKGAIKKGLSDEEASMADGRNTKLMLGPALLTLLHGGLQRNRKLLKDKRYVNDVGKHKITAQTANTQVSSAYSLNPHEPTPPKSDTTEMHRPESTITTT